MNDSAQLVGRVGDRPAGRLERHERRAALGSRTSAAADGRRPAAGRSSPGNAGDHERGSACRLDPGSSDVPLARRACRSRRSRPDSRRPSTQVGELPGGDSSSYWTRLRRRHNPVVTWSVGRGQRVPGRRHRRRPRQRPGRLRAGGRDRRSTRRPQNLADVRDQRRRPARLVGDQRAREIGTTAPVSVRFSEAGVTGPCRRRETVVPGATAAAAFAVNAPAARPSCSAAATGGGPEAARGAALDRRDVGHRAPARALRRAEMAA